MILCRQRFGKLSSVNFMTCKYVDTGYQVITRLDKHCEKTGSFVGNPCNFTESAHQLRLLEHSH